MRQEPHTDPGEQGAGQRGQRGAVNFIRDAQQVRIGKEGKCRYPHDPGGQTVKPINEVHRVHRQDNNQNRQQDTRERVEQQRPRDRQPQDLNPEQRH